MEKKQKTLEFFLRAKILIMKKNIIRKKEELSRSFDKDTLKAEIKDLRYCIDVAENKLLYTK